MMNVSAWVLIQQAYVTGWIVAAPIGPVNLEIIRRSLRDRIRTGLFVGLGAVSVDVCYLTLFSVGLGTFLRIPVISTVLHFAGGALLAVLGIMALLDGRGYLLGRKQIQLDNATPEQKRFGRSPIGNYLLGVGMTGLNPMTIAFWSALSLQFAGLPVIDRAIASAALFCGCFSWVLTLLIVLRFARSWIGPRLFGVVTIAGGLCLLYFGIDYIAKGAGLDAFFVRFA